MKILNRFSQILGTVLLFSNTASAIVFNMAPLEFTNRAGCADLSTKPARSVFLQVDSFNAGKAGFAQGILAQKTQPKENPDLWAAKSAKEFRLWSSHLASDIMNALVKGQLPLLQQDGTTPAIYNRAVEKCLSKNQFLSCPSMNDLLSDIWSRSKMKNPNWQELGLSKNDFLPSKLQVATKVGCHIVRKFSAFHSPLATQQIDNGVLTNIAMESFNPENTLDSCFSLVEGPDARFTTVQLDIANLANDNDWNAYGFQFWHSFKLFYSWAWRYAPEYIQEFGSLKQSFSSITFEDSVMLVPNGCRSVELPKCDSAGLSSDVLRAAAVLGTIDPTIGELPERPIDTLFMGRPMPVNNDSLGLFKSGDASKWSRDFKKHLSNLRTFMMTKLNTGIPKLQIITSLMSADEMSKDINMIKNDPNSDGVETYLACTEYTLAKNNLFKDIDAEIKTLNNNQELQSVLLADSGKDLATFINYYEKLTETMGSFCAAFEASGHSAAGTKDSGIYRSLNEWAFDLLRPTMKNAYFGKTKLSQCEENPSHIACPKNQDKKYLVSHPRQSNGPGQEAVICRTSLECARTVLQSLISIVSVRRYAHAFLPLDDIMKSPDLFNNFAVPTACRLYDPWSKQRNAWKLFVADLGSALLQGASCGAMQFKVLELPENKVVGYREIFNQEQISYGAVTERESMKYVAGIDVQFLPSLSCGAAVSNNLLTAQNAPASGYYTQLSLRTCDGTSNTEYTVDKSALLDPALNQKVRTDKQIKELCFQCAFGLKSIVQSACVAPYVGQIASAGVGLFQGVIRLISNLRDPDNIVKNSQVNVDQISVSFQGSPGESPVCHKNFFGNVVCLSKKVGN